MNPVSCRIWNATEILNKKRRLRKHRIFKCKAWALSYTKQVKLERAFITKELDRRPTIFTSIGRPTMTKSLLPSKRSWYFPALGFGKSVLFVLAISLTCFFALPSPVLATDFSKWDQLLKQTVATKTIAGVQLTAVNYKKIKSDPIFAEIITELEKVSLGELKSREEKLSFWINVYNILAVKMIVDHHPIKSIKKAGGLFKSVWKLPIGVVAGKQRTLNEVEHEILRKMDDPRIHVAIVCASVSCPDLRPSAFTADQLDNQLDEQMKSFLTNPGKGLRFDSAKKKVTISKIFDWFEDDFESRGGVLKVLSQYVGPADGKALLNPKLKVSYLKYNWDINEL